MFFLVSALCSARLFSFGSGVHLQLRADLGGSLTMPSITQEGLKALNPRAVGLHGLMSDLLMGVEVEAGYIFRAHDFFGLSEKNPFSGIGAFFALGFSQASTGQKISAVEGTSPLDIFMTVNFLPVINFGGIGKAYFFNNRLAVGIGIYGRMIADMNPDYLLYSSEPSLIPTEVGTIVITEDMIKKMNPFMASAKFLVEYNIPVYKTVEVILGGYICCNIYAPKYITVPASLLNMLNPEELANLQQPRPDYWLNSLNFGVSMALAFKL